mmetsp:Transcript_21043/g.44879  ORF Transcript_21043/g.44879 Transcript_21043/m.44879 type:complete len:110 (-) Transcript_21043:166-495(-)
MTKREPSRGPIADYPEVPYVAIPWQLAVAITMLGCCYMRIAKAHCSNCVGVLTYGEAQYWLFSAASRLASKVIGQQTNPELSQLVTLDVKENGFRSWQRDSVTGGSPTP